MTRASKVLESLDKLNEHNCEVICHSNGKFSIYNNGKYLDEFGHWIPKEAMVHSSDWMGVAYSSREKALKNAMKYGITIE